MTVGELGTNELKWIQDTATGIPRPDFNYLKDRLPLVC